VTRSAPRRALGYLLFVLVVPGTGGVYLPWLVLTGGGAMPQPTAWPGAALIGAGLVLDLWCFWVFLTVGRGTPATWDAPRRVVAVGPYRWVRNPIYIGALLAVTGGAWLFLSLPLVVYTIVLALGFHLLVVAYEEPTLQARFGEEYESFRRSVPRWIPRLPPRWSQGVRERSEEATARPLHTT
jgi:protein-S-isoprenylcysteine O-methyltransferase Ste14